MTNSASVTTPRSGLIVTVPQHQAFDQESWQWLYLPVLGADAFAVYDGLKTFTTDRPQLSTRRLHSELLGWLNMDLPTFVAARRRLEALGLLETLYQTDSVGDVYVYQLQLPLSAQAFFADDLLSILLLQLVGQPRYDTVLDHFDQPMFDVSHLTNVSADFLEVYHINEQQLANRPAQLTAPMAAATLKQTGTPAIDFSLLANYLKPEYVDVDSVLAERELLTAEAQLYGFTERELANHIVKATSVTTNRFDPERFKRLVAGSFQMEQQSSSSSQADQASVAAAPVTASASAPATVDAQTAGLLAAAKAYAPADFLAALKQEKNQYVTDNEQRVLSKLMERHLFAPSVVNMLIYYLINDQDQNVLYQNSVDRIGNDWSKAKVQTPEQAVTHMREFATAQEQRRIQRQTGRGGQTVSREQLPDWNEQASSSAATQPASQTSDDIARLRSQIQQAKQEQEDQ
ncbi:DnaD domain protein [Furfurilactobacillus sp. WILCCON 0119]